jgi:hypothetical protein
MQERDQLNEKFNQDGGIMSNDELPSLGDRFIILEVLESELSVEFNQQMKRILLPVKVLRLYQTENQYRQQLLNELQDRKQQQKDNPNQQRQLS